MFGGREGSDWKDWLGFSFDDGGGGWWCYVCGIGSGFGGGVVGSEVVEDGGVNP
jgi:hypothetical protein